MTSFLSSKGQTADSLVKKLGLPLVNKLKISSGGKGIYFVDKLETIEKHINETSYFEKIIKGSEGSLESFIVNRETIFTNITQYYKNRVCNILPAQVDEVLQRRIETLNS